MIAEMTAEELEGNCRTYIALKAKDMAGAKRLLKSRYARVETDEADYLRVYDIVPNEEIVTFLHQNGVTVSEIRKTKIGLEEYYIDLMHEKEGR